MHINRSLLCAATFRNVVSFNQEEIFPGGFNRMKYVCAVSICACLAATALFAGEVPQVGQQAPSFELPSQDGSDHTLKDYKGKWVVLYFYPKDMTQGCTIEAHGFQNDLAKYDAANAVILGVSVDSVDSHKQFCTKDSLTFKLLADTEKKTVDAYGSLNE